MIDSLIVKLLQQTFMPKMHQHTLGGRNRGHPTSNGRDISIYWSQDGTTSLKYKAQQERRVSNSSHILLMANKHRKFFVIQAHKKVQIYA